MTNYAQKYTFRPNTFKSLTFRAETLAGGITSTPNIPVSFSKIFNVDWTKLLEQEKIIGADYVSKSSASKILNLNWLANITEIKRVNIDWLNKLSGNKQSAIEYLQFVANLNFALNISYNSFLQKVLPKNIDWQQKLSNDKIFAVDYKSTQLINRIIDISYLQTITPTTVINVDYGGGVTAAITANKIFNLDWLQSLEKLPKFNISFLSFIIKNREKSIDWLSGLSSIYNFDTENLQSLNLSSFINLSYLQSLAYLSKFNIDYGGNVTIGFSSEKSLNIDWNQILNSSYEIDLSSISILQKILNKNIDWQSKIYDERIINLENLGNVFEQKKNNINWAKIIYLNNATNIDFGQTLVLSNISPISNLSITNNNSIINIEWLKSLSGLPIFGIDYSGITLSSLSVNKILPIDYIAGLILAQNINADNISRVGQNKNIDIDWLFLTSLLISRQIPISYIFSLFQSNAANIDFSKILAESKILNIDYSGTAITYPISIHSIFNVDWWLRPSGDGTGQWILSTRGRSWVLDAKIIQWVLPTLSKDWTLSSR